MARSLYICYFGIREPLVQTQVIPYLRELVKGGHEISLLTFEPNNGVAKLQSYGVAELQNEEVAELQNEEVTELQNEEVAELQNEEVTELQSYGVAELQNEEVGELQSSSAAELQDEEVGELQSYGVAKLERELAEQGIEWHWLRYHKRPTVPATFFDVMNGAREVRKMLRRERFDILHARGHVPAVMAALARKGMRHRPKILFDIRGFVPEEYTDAGIWPEGGWLYRTVKRMERWLMREADGFVVLTEKAREILFPSEHSAVSSQQSEVSGQRSAVSGQRSAVRSQQSAVSGQQSSISDRHSAVSNQQSEVSGQQSAVSGQRSAVSSQRFKNPPANAGGSDSRPVEAIPCCVDLDRFKNATPETRTLMRDKLGITDRYVMAYVGAFGGWYLTRETVDLFGVLNESRNNAFAMILTQSDPAMIEPLLRQGGYLESDLIITRVPSNEIPDYLCAADVAVSFIKRCYSKQSSSPTKNAEYLACGLPIIANRGVGDVDALIEGNAIGALVDEFTQAAFLKALRDIEALGDINDRCREVARREFDLELVGGVRYRRIYQKLTE